MRNATLLFILTVTALAAIKNTGKSNDAWILE
jgi:hypothetical protein